MFAQPIDVTPLRYYVGFRCKNNNNTNCKLLYKKKIKCNFDFLHRLI